MYDIGIDVRMLRHTGIGTYLKGLLRELPNQNEISKKQIALFGPAQAGRVGEIYQSIHFSAPIYSIREQITYPGLVKQCRLWHAPHYNCPIRKGKSKLVVTIHDIIHWIYRDPWKSPFKAVYAEQMNRRAVKCADHIIAVSAYTRDDLIRHFGAHKERISVVHEAVDEFYQKNALPESDRARILLKLGVNAPYFLYVGLIKPHKNVLALVNAVKKLRRQNQTKSAVVVVGKKDSAYAAKHQELMAIKTDNDLVYLPYVTKEQLSALYAGAVALVHPSYYEGFGLTLLEAMACGTPVLASNRASIPEIAGNAAHYFNPLDETALLPALIAIENDESLRAQLIDNGKKRLHEFSWQKTARQTSEIYNRVLEGL
ncbi:MAG: hypothetical protein A2Z83_05050 [Omnitrophica bacterium GWA2_52_8]|nr:MAG: hypothetical protein A2Z83_05050 [Omnitrophica bacterium GWA2_52_8]